MKTRQTRTENRLRKHTEHNRNRLWAVKRNDKGQETQEITTQGDNRERHRTVERIMCKGHGSDRIDVCSLTSTGCLLWLASNFKHWCLHTRQLRDQPPAYSQKLIRSDTPARPLRSATSGCLALPHHHTCTPRLRLLSVQAQRW